MQGYVMERLSPGKVFMLASKLLKGVVFGELGMGRR
jgi:hypothetical protein